MTKTGLLFGSFNPIHNGHIAIAVHLLEKKITDQVWFVLSPQNPLKSKNNLLDNNERLQILKIVVGKNAKMHICEVEFNLPKPSYTYLTMRELTQNYPQNEFFIVIGADIIQTFNKWKKYDELIEKYKFIIYPRNNNFKIEALQEMNYIITDMQLIDISSSMIREKLSKGENVSEYMPKEAVNYILAKSLYTK